MVKIVTATGPPGDDNVVSVVPGAEAWKSNRAASNSQYGSAATKLPVADASDPVVDTLIVCFSIAIKHPHNKQRPRPRNRRYWLGKP